MISKAASSAIFWDFGMTRPVIEPRSPGPLANTLLIRPMACLKYCTLLKKIDLVSRTACVEGLGQYINAVPWTGQPSLIERKESANDDNATLLTIEFNLTRWWGLGRKIVICSWKKKTKIKTIYLFQRVKGSGIKYLK